MERKNSTIIWLVILAVATLTQICTDMYTPSLPAIAHYFHASVGQAQYTMTVFMLGVALTALFYGPMSEVVGRRWTLALGILLGVIGSGVCYFADSITMMQVGRLIQGAGLGACSSLWRSIFRDTYSGDELASKTSYLSNAVLISVILAPLAGGFIEEYLGWHVTFTFLFVWSVLVLLVVLFLFKESGQHHGKHRLNLKFITSTYGELLFSRHFMGYTLCAFLSYGALFSWLTAGPVILIHGVGLTPTVFGSLAIIIGIVMMVASTMNGKLVKTIGSQAMMQIGWAIMFIAGVLTLIGYKIWGISFWPVFIPSMIMIFGATLTFPNTFANAFANIGHIAGYGAAVYSCVQLMGGVLFSAVLSHLSTSSQAPMAWTFIISGAAAWLMYKLVAAKG